MKTLKDWFKEGCDFWDGVALLRAAGGDITFFAPHLKQSFVSIDIKQILKSRLQNLPHDIQIGKKSYEATSTLPVAPPPAVIMALKAKSKKLHKLQSDLHSRLFFEENELKRYALIVELMQVVRPALDEIHDEIRRFEKTGELPEAVESPVATGDSYKTGVKDGVLKSQRLINIRTRITKLDGKTGLVATATDAVRKDILQKELLSKITERDELIAEINEMLK